MIPNEKMPDDPTQRLLNAVMLSGHERQPTGWVVWISDHELEVTEVVGPYAHPREAQAEKDHLAELFKDGMELEVLPMYSPDPEG